MNRLLSLFSEGRGRLKGSWRIVSSHKCQDKVRLPAKTFSLQPWQVFPQEIPQNCAHDVRHTLVSTKD